jgi:hypothetical protein
MRESLKNIFSNQISISNKDEYYYNIHPYELKNPLGNVIALLKEYKFIKKDAEAGEGLIKLYKTEQDNWYEIEDANLLTEKPIIRMLKAAIDAKENKLHSEKIK